MDELGKKLLVEVQEHWRQLRFCKTPEEFETEGWGGQSCAFCKAHEGPSSCKGCPINNVTGKTACGGTPYADAAEAIEEFCSGIVDKLDVEPINEMCAFLETLE